VSGGVPSPRGRPCPWATQGGRGRLEEERACTGTMPVGWTRRQWSAGALDKPARGQCAQRKGEVGALPRACVLVGRGASVCVYIGPNPVLLPGRGMKEDRLSMFTTHPRGESAGSRARATFVAGRQHFGGRKGPRAKVSPGVLTTVTLRTLTRLVSVWGRHGGRADVAHARAARLRWLFVISGITDRRLGPPGQRLTCFLQ